MSRPNKPKAEAAATAPVVLPDLSVEGKVDQLAQALLREYLHRTGCKETLALFDGENPRTAKTISSRGVMAGLMHMDVIQNRNKQRSKPFSSFMELLCTYRLRKRRLNLEKVAKGAPHTSEYDSSDDDEQQGNSVPLLEAALAQTQQRIAQLKQRIEAAQKIIDNPPQPSSQVVPAPSDGDAKKVKKSKKDKSASDANGTAAAESADGEAASKQKEKKRSKAAKKALAAGGSATFDPLGLSSSLGTSKENANAVDSSLLISTGKRTTGAGPVGHKWNPFGANIPAVGLDGAAHANVPPPSEDSEWRPNYVAGAGMELTTNRVRAAVVPLDAAISDSPTRGAAQGIAAKRRLSSEATEDSPGGSEPSSPMTNKSTYDPHAKSHGVLVKGEHNVAVDGKGKPRKRVVIVGDP